MEPTIAQLRLIDRVARSGSFTVAAQESRLTQPALSRTVRDVERGMQVRLFERTTRSVTLTADGAAFIEVARDALAAYDNALGRFAAYRAAESGTVTVAALPSVAAGRLPSLLAAFAGDHPDVTLHVLDGDHAEVLEYLRSGAADIAITEQPKPEEGLGVHPLHEDALLALLPRDHPLSGNDTVTWRELAAYTVIRLSPGSSVAQLAASGFAAAEASPSRVISTRTVAIAGGMVAAGLGVTTITESVLPLVDSDAVVSRPLIEPSLSRRLAVVYRRSPALPPAGQALLARICGDDAASHAARRAGSERPAT